MSFEFIHAADIHLDSPLHSLARYDDFPVELFREAPRQALKNLVALALDRKVSFVLIAGDLYDGQWDESRTGFFLAEQLGRLREAGIPVIAIYGNHDAETRMTNHIRFPDNVRFLSAQAPESYELLGIDCVVHGQSFAQQEARENLVQAFPSPEPNRFNIGLLHTSLEGSSEHVRYAPCAINDLTRLGYDYWALGHIHHRRIVNQEPPIVYPGNLQGRRNGESGAKGAYVVSVDRTDIGFTSRLEFHELDEVRWETIEASIDDLMSLDEWYDLVREQLVALKNAPRVQAIAVRVIATGSGPLHAELAGNLKCEDELRGLFADLGQRKLWLEKLKRRTQPSTDRAVNFDEGPLSELKGVFEELLGSNAAPVPVPGEGQAAEGQAAEGRETHDSAEKLREVAQLFDELKRKLPADLAHDLEVLKAWSDPNSLRAALEETVPFLETFLRQAERGS